MKEINFDEVIVLNLKSLDDNNLFIICEYYNLDFEWFCLKRKDGYFKEFLTKDGIGFYSIIHHMYNNRVVELCENNKMFGEGEAFSDKLKKLPCVKIPKLKKTSDVYKKYFLLKSKGYNLNIPSLEDKSFLNVDKVLDKITESGMDSLSSKERKFLDRKSGKKSEKVEPIVKETKKVLTDKELEDLLIIQFDQNFILDKISKYGIDYITKDELDYLNSTAK